MNVVLYFGSFNPVHIGHLALANYVCEYRAADQLWFVVSPHNPFKEEARLMDDELRLELVREAAKGYPWFRVCDVEFHLPRPSYTIHTLDHLHRQYPAYTFTLLVGSDNWESISDWYQSERILSENRLLIYPRPGHPVDASSLPEGVTLLDAPLLEVSSTFVCQAMRAGKDVRYFLHPAVYERLRKHFSV